MDAPFSRRPGTADAVTGTVTSPPASGDAIRRIAAFCWAPDLLPAGPQREAERKRQRRRIRNLNVRA